MAKKQQSQPEIIHKDKPKKPRASTKSERRPVIAVKSSYGKHAHLAFDRDVMTVCGKLDMSRNPNGWHSFTLYKLEEITCTDCKEVLNELEPKFTGGKPLTQDELKKLKTPGERIVSHDFKDRWEGVDPAIFDKVPRVRKIGPVKSKDETGSKK